MRIAILSTILATAGVLAACSSGGPGSLEISALDLGREPSGDGYEPPPNRGGSITSSQDPTGTQSGTQNGTKKDGGGNTVTDFDAATVDPGIDSSVVKRDSSVTATDASAVTGTCTDLDACCPSLPSSAQSGCTQLVTNGNDSTCGSALNSYKQAGYCN